MRRGNLALSFFDFSRGEQRAEGVGDNGPGLLGADHAGIAAGSEVARDDRAGGIDEDALRLGATAIDAAQATLVLVSRVSGSRVSEPSTPTSAQPSRPNSSDPRSQAATGDPRGGGGTATLCRRSTARAKPDASYWVTASSVIPNCTPVEPSSVPTEIGRAHV